MMINPRLTNYPECSDIPVLLQDIECKITEVAKSLYNNTIFSLNNPIPFSTMIDLLNYRRILNYKYCNPSYAESFSIAMIASKVKLLKYK
jgi:hypothetical protein